MNPVELRLNDSSEDLETVIRATYKQVLGNAYVMESERLAVPESQFKDGRITVREFVRQVAQSYLYKSRFFDNCPRIAVLSLTSSIYSVALLIVTMRQIHTVRF